MTEHAQLPHTSERHPVTPGAIYDIRQPMDVQLAPDGRLAAFSLHEWIGGRPKRRARIWTVDTASGEARPLTTGTGNDTTPRWSPDGRRLAFVSTRETNADQEKGQLYVISAAGGQAQQVCEMSNGVNDLAWSPDGSRIAFLALEGPEPQRDPIVVGPGRHHRLWTVRTDDEGGDETPEPVTPHNLTIWEYAWSPDGQHFAVYCSDGPDVTDWYRGQVGIVDACGGAVRQVTQLSRQAGALAWSPDSARIAYVSGEWSDPGIVGGELFVVAAEGGEPRNLTPGIEFSLSLARWRPNGHSLLYAGWDGVAHQIGWLDEDDGARTELSVGFIIGERHWPRVSPSADLHTVTVIHSDPEHAPEVWLGDLPRKKRAGDGLRWRQLTHLNALPEQTLAIAPSECVSYSGADGWQIRALFTPPVRPTRGTLPPLVVNVHGGPSSAWLNDWTGGMLTQMLASHGFAVLRANIRGSLGRGVAFADAVVGDMGGKDLEDLLAGVDELARRGVVDGTRVGICGWSYGGFMTAWAISQTDRFKAAMMGAGVCDFHSFHAQTNIPDWDMRFLAADPLEQPERYRARSAISFASRIATPTLILHGEKDECVPVSQAYAFYRALGERGTPAELVVYPREGHGPQECAHLVDMEERVLRWFQMYL